MATTAAVITMSMREADRLKTIQAVVDRMRRVGQAAQRLELGRRQVENGQQIGTRELEISGEVRACGSLYLWLSIRRSRRCVVLHRLMTADAAFSCNGCHGSSALGSEGKALNRTSNTRSSLPASASAPRDRPHTHRTIGRYRLASSLA